MRILNERAADHVASGAELLEGSLGAMTHELRAPIAGLRLLVDRLARQLDADADAASIPSQQLIEAIDQRSRELTRRINHLLDVTRLCP